MLTKKCPICYKNFSKPSYCSLRVWGIRQFCSKECAVKGSIGHPAPKSAFKKGYKSKKRLKLLNKKFGQLTVIKESFIKK